MSETASWMRRLGPRQLETLLVIARTGSLSRAAEQMATTQPGLSKWLKDLETSLEVTLFDRTTRRLSVTAFGDIVLRYAERVLGDAERTYGEVLALKAGRLGRLQLGILPGLGPLLVPNAIRWLQAEGLSLDVRLNENTLDVMLPQLHEHKFDLLVARLDSASRNSGANWKILFTETVCAMAAADHPLHRRKRIGWADATRYRWVLPVSGSPMHRHFENALDRAGLPMPDSILESASTLTNRAMAQIHGCLFLTSEHTALALERDGSMRRLPLRFPEVVNEVAVLWMVETLSPQQRHMIHALEAAAGRLAAC